MIDDRGDPNRPPNPYDEPPLGRDPVSRRPPAEEDTGRGLAAALTIIVLLVGGLFWYGATHERNTDTANYQPPAQLNAPAAPSAASPPVRPNPDRGNKTE
jgi:hypothetical protein